MANSTDVLIFEEARRRLITQEGRVDDMRSRGLTTLGAGGVVIGLFGIRVGTHPEGWRLAFAVLAVAAFAVCAAGAVILQWPFTVDQGDKLEPWLDRLRSPEQNVDAFASDMAHSFEDAVRQNRPHYRRLTRISLAVQAAFGAEVLLWAVEVVF